MRLESILFNSTFYQQNGKQIEMAVQAVTTINELLYRPLCAPDVTDTLLVEIFRHGVTLFQLMERLDSVNERYLILRLILHIVIS